MLRLSTSTVAAIALHAADQAWVIFAQLHPPNGPGPVKIESIRGPQLMPRMRTLVADNPYELYLIGMIATPGPMDAAALAFAQEYPSAHLHDGWFEPSTELMSYIEQNASASIQDLLAVTHPAGVEGTEAVSIDEIAAMLGVSVPTVRRMVKANEIPFLRWGGKTLRFVPADVFASLRAND